MPRKLLIFGNGLGMSLDQNHFSLQNALNDIWNRQGFLSAHHKQLIEACVGNAGAPPGEDHLGPFQVAATCCQALNKIAQETGVKETGVRS